MKAGLSLQFPVVVQSGEPVDVVMKAQIYCSVLYPRSLTRVSVDQQSSVHRAAFFLEALGRTLFPAFSGPYVASFLGLEPIFFGQHSLP